MKPYLLFLLLALRGTVAPAQGPAPHPDLLKKPWTAQWIAVPGAPAKGYGVYRFRKKIRLAEKPAAFVVHVSADNRYKLMVNNHLVALGPARSDLYHWNFESVDIAPYLAAGDNVLAALVWNEGDARPEAQVSHRTAFILQGNTAAEAAVNTGPGWRCVQDTAYRALPPTLIYAYYVSGPGESVDGRLHSRDWTLPSFGDSSWKAAQPLFYGLPKGVFAYTDGWMLVPGTLPPMERSPQRFAAVRRAEGLRVPDGFPAQRAPVTVPAHTKATLLLDQGFLTNAYPELAFSGGRDAVVSLRYAEALYIDEGSARDWRVQNAKGHRDSIAGKRFVGREDRVVSDGSAGQVYSPLSWRTYRYVQLQVETGAEGLVIGDLRGTFTGYPFRFNAAFAAGDPVLDRILETGWRTARLCAVETYMDCPYYEQLQYVGDTRIQGLVSLYNSGDDRLLRNALTQIDRSRMAEGITMSRFPTANAQQIPPFSLWWIGMLHDYWTYRGDSAFIRGMLPGARQVLQFFSRYQGTDGTLRHAPYWNFTDWVESPGWRAGMAPVDANGRSAALDLQLLWAYQLAAALEAQLGMPAYAALYRGAAARLEAAIRKWYWDGGRQLFADTPEKATFSQHVNTLAILTGLVQGTAAGQLAGRLLADTALTQATIYFKYYVHRALVQGGKGNDYLNWLGLWKENLAQGMTTWAEMSDISHTRSDCHAWGAHPNIELLRTVLGVDSDAPGFARVKVAPHLGTLQQASGTVPHPKGAVGVDYRQEGGRWKVTVRLPPGTPGHLLWAGKRHGLQPGANHFTF